MSISRRGLMLGAVGTLGPFLALAKAVAQTEDERAAAMARSEQAHNDLMNIEGLRMMGQEQIAMLLYPGFTALDLVGPQYMFASMMGATVHLVTQGPDLAPVMSDTGLAIAPTVTIKDCPQTLDLLFAPGGAAGTAAALKNKTLIDFLASRGAEAGLVTSVCTGSLLLGQAGLLMGRKATSHWVVRHVLDRYGATPVDARVVRDGNLVTGAGVSAGLDFGLEILASLRGAPYAQAIQLQAEYAPEPPFTAGTPESAPEELAEALRGMFAPLVAQVEAAAADWSAVQ